MVLGLRDYVEKNRFPGVVLGLSGGIDSALSAAVAVDALGADRVRCVMMPSPLHHRATAWRTRPTCARLLGVRLDEHPDRAGDARPFTTMLAPLFAGRAPDITEENIQARIRGADR